MYGGSALLPYPLLHTIIFHFHFDRVYLHYGVRRLLVTSQRDLLFIKINV